jgi:hypothetical protein
MSISRQKLLIEKGVRRSLQSAFQQVATLPGIGDYDSSDSSNTTSSGESASDDGKPKYDLTGIPLEWKKKKTDHDQ